MYSQSLELGEELGIFASLQRDLLADFRILESAGRAQKCFSFRGLYVGGEQEIFLSPRSRVVNSLILELEGRVGVLGIFPSSKACTYRKD